MEAEMKAHVAIVLAFIAALTFAGLGAACGGNGDALTLEEFLQQIVALDAAAEQQSAADEPALDALPDENVDVANVLRHQIAILEEFAAGIEELDAPEEATELKEELSADITEVGPNSSTATALSSL